MDKRKVIIVTDGDMVAKGAVEQATKNINGRCISSSAGNPTNHSGEYIKEQIKKASHDPVVVMVDDRGVLGHGKGEAVIDSICNDSDIEVLGVVAVASNMEKGEPVTIDASVTNTGQVVNQAVDKNGNKRDENICYGDTLSILKDLNIPLIICIGDPGKMDYKDEVSKGAPITTKALKEILVRSGFYSDK
ncbi:MAG: stage V sporulation protein AE [Mahellales bacterium]|jgi:stage V sporulation protein AE